MADIVGGTPYGRGDALVNVSGAVLLRDVSVVTVDAVDSTGAARILAMQLGGRVNKTENTASTMYLFDVDGAAAIVSELLGLAARIGPEFRELLLARIAALP